MRTPLTPAGKLATPRAMTQTPGATPTVEPQEGTSATTRIPHFVRAFLVVALSSTSLFLALAQCVLARPLGAFFHANQADLRTRLTVLGISWGTGALVGAVGLNLIHRAPAPERASHVAQKLFAPLAVSCFLPVLFFHEPWRGREIALLCYTLAVGLALERLARPAFRLLPAWLAARLHDGPIRSAVRRAGRWLPLLVVLVLAAAYIARIGHLTNVSHIKLATMSSDLAEYDNLFFNALNGRPFRSPAIAGHLENWSTLQGHAEFGLYLLLPFYAIAPGAGALLWIQTSVVGLTSVPIFLFGKDRLGSLGGLCFATAYLLTPAVQQPNFYDFHFTPLGMFFVSWLLYFAVSLSKHPTSRRRRIGLYVSMALALLCREDISIGVTVVGVFLVLSGALVRDGIVLSVLAGTYFVSMKFGIMPLFGRWWFDDMYADLKAEGSGGFAAVILTLVSNPSFVVRTMLTEAKFLYLLHMTVPVLALWLRRPLLWLAILPGLVQTLLVTNRPPSFQSSFQYTYLWIPYVFAASILATRRGLAGASTLVPLLLVASSLSFQFGVFPTGERILGGFSTKTFKITPAEQRRYEDLQEIIAKIPKEATLAVTESEGPHVSSRPTMYSLKYTLGHDPEFLLMSIPRHRGEVQHVRQALESGDYGVVAQSGSFVLMQRGADTKRNGLVRRMLPKRERRR